jgi:hypothetical protein
VTSHESPVQPKADAEFDSSAPRDEAQRKARIEIGLRKCQDSLMEARRELDRTLVELEKEQGIFERWFGYRTSV